MNTKKQYSKPQVIKVGDAIKTTLGKNSGPKRDFLIDNRPCFCG